MQKENILKTKSFAFAVRVAKLYKFLCDTKKEFVLSKQLLRSGTSVGANIREANNAESKLDFIHKLAIAQKECDETIYWLEILFSIDLLNKQEFESLFNDANEILKILKSSIITTKSSIKKFKNFNS
jgi:four helix bundle protein